MDDVYLPPIAAAKIMSVSVKLIYKLIDKGELEVLRVGRSVRILATSLQAFIARNTMRPGEPPAPSPIIKPTPHQRKPGRTGFVFLPPAS
jgi:excisionase family DNA binding protein